MGREYIISAVAAILEDIFRYRMGVKPNEEIEPLFEPHQLKQFKKLVSREFDISGSVIVDSCLNFRELYALIEDEISC